MKVFSSIGGFKMAKSIGIKKTDILGEVIQNYPEVAPVFAKSGLHCIGCHVSAYESLEDGCLAHGMTKKDVDDLVKEANKRIAEYNKLPKMAFTKKAFIELGKRVGNKKFIKIVQVFGGEFDFSAADKKEKGDVLIEAKSESKTISVLALPQIERMLRGVEIDYDAKAEDFTANRTTLKK